MPKSAYPADSDLADLLTSTKLTIPENLDLQSKVDAAIAEWETRTGWFPYLAALDDADPPQPIIATRLFDPPAPAGRNGGSRSGRVLSLGAGLLALTSLAVGVVPDASGHYSAVSGAGGTLLVNNLNFYLRPQNAIAKGLAITEVELLVPSRGVPQSIAITGVWGRTLLLEDNVWQAILQRAASLCAPELSLSISGGYFERKIGDSLKRFGGAGESGPLSQQVTLWEGNFNRCVMNKKRITV